jgi:Domain of unknown function (DUF4440)
LLASYIASSLLRFMPWAMETWRPFQRRAQWMLMNRTGANFRCIASQNHVAAFHLSTATSFQFILSKENEILLTDEELWQAMRNSNVDALDGLLDDDLMFFSIAWVEVMGKQDDLDLDRKGIVTIQALKLSHMQVKILPSDIGIVTVAAPIVRSFAGDSFEGRFRLTRFRQTKADKWRIVGVHSSLSS